jgi:hypothetical protein
VITLDSIQGHWVRRWIRAPGFEDGTTRVHWMQAGWLYADVRIPLVRPDLTRRRSLSEVPVAELLALAEAEGFAGDVELAGSHCTWHRRINWHGAPDGADIGDISFDASGRMIEKGVLADYTELWEQHATNVTGRAYRATGEGYEAFLVSRDGRFVFGVGQPGKPSTRPALDLQKGGGGAVDFEAVFDGLHAFGRLVGDAAVADLATQPFAEGRPVATLKDDRLIWHRIGIDGTTRDIVMPLAETRS